MLGEDRESIRKMKADFEEIADLVENDFKGYNGFGRRMNHYNTVYSVAIRNTPKAEYPGYDVGELLYMDYQEMLTRYLLRHRDLVASSEVEMFDKVLNIWKHYKILMRWNMKAFAYLSRYYIVNNSKPSLEQVAVSIFLEQIYKKHSELMSTVTLDLLARDRAGQVTNKDKIQQAIELLSTMKIEDAQLAYKDNFFKDYILQTERDSEKALRSWAQSLGASDFLDKVIQAIEEERGRCAYFSPKDANTIMSRVEEVFVCSPISRDHILTSNDGFLVGLEKEDTDFLTRCFSLFSLKDSGLQQLAELFASTIVKKGETLSESYKNEETHIDVVTFVREMMRLQEVYPRILNTCFKMDFVVSKALREGLEGAYNTSVEVTMKSGGSVRIKFCLWLATYADLVLQNKVPDSDEELERIAVTLSYITERDLLLNSLRDKMASRILLPVREFNENVERAFIQRIRQRYGPSSTSYLEGMLHDVLLSNDFSVMQQLEQSGKTATFDITLLVAKKGIWPEEMFAVTKFSLPPFIQAQLNAVQEIYLADTTGRSLSWSHENSSAELVMNLNNKMSTLFLSALQALILLSFNESDSLKTKDLMERYQCPLDLLRTSILPLIKGKIILVSDPSPEKINEESTVSINMGFVPKRRKLKIPPSLIRMSVSDEVRGEKKALALRKSAVDACIIKIMKSRRQISHKDLMAECKKQLSVSFEPDIKVFKNSIEDLVKRDFIERDTSCEGYNYLA